VYIGIQVPISIFGGILLGRLLNQKIRARAVFRGIYFLPVITSVVVLGIIWSWMYGTTQGVINYLLSRVGIAPVPWLTSPKWSMPSVAIMKIWTDIPFYGVLFLAAIQSLPAEVLEAAKIDGATGWDLFWRIEIPLLSPTIAFSIVMGTIWGLQLFTEPFLMTGGGPMNSSQTVTLYLYREGFTWGRYTYACAIGVVSALIVFVVSYIQRRLTERFY
jgi:multiple sugar transport system permease protein